MSISSVALSHNTTIVSPSCPPTCLECSHVSIQDLPVHHLPVLLCALSSVVATYNCSIPPCHIVLGPVALPSGLYS
ncbi:hypothetical protein BD779DRAFT_1677516 [Infundibulicybe gibba]|nr:hypothetical protein BD779DRAFT_1677516 [Infundibulicybe gibba]